MIRNERTLHTVRGYRVLGAQKRFKYGKNWTNSAHSTRLPRSWEPKNDANIIRNERTLHAARGYRVVGAQKMVQFFLRNERTLHTARGYRVVGNPKMMQIW